MLPLRNKITLALLGLVLLLAGGVGLWLRPTVPNTPASSSALINGESFQLELAQSPEALARGLSERESLCERCGMLFLFPHAGRQGFWMKGMRFPLDILWLQGDQIVHIERRIPADSPAVYRPPVAADRVLELPAGAADGLSVGERLQFLPE